MLVAVIALVSSLTVGAVAATQIDTGDIENGAVTKKKLHKNSVNSKKVKNKTLKAKDFAEGQLEEGVQGIQGLKGDKGAPGQDGQDGADGTNGATNVTTRVATESLDDNDRATLTKNCNAGEKAVGGGYAIANSPEPEVFYVEGGPSPATDGSTPTGWTNVFDINNIPHTVTTFVVCASP